MSDEALAPEKPATQTATPVRDLDEAQLDALMQRISEAKEHNLALSGDDYDVLMNAILTLANMQERLSHNDLTVAKMKKLLGMVNSSEKLDKLRPQSKAGAATGSNTAQTKKSYGRRDKQKRNVKPIKPTVHHHLSLPVQKSPKVPIENSPL